jgi:2-polyprenyl-3-methyl-5-hydroxy-6-metoxy-1,4-benzoquinol methylase
LGQGRGRLAFTGNGGKSRIDDETFYMMTKAYQYEDQCYRDIHRDGKPYYQHEVGDPCDPDLQHLFDWESFPRQGSDILELGCGDGFVTATLASKGLSVTGVDCSVTAIQRARTNLASVRPAPNLCVGDACDLNCVESESYDYVLDCHCLHCITDYRYRAHFLIECRRVLSREGRLFVATMGEQSMEWTKTIARSPWQTKRDAVYATDEKGCYVESLIPPGRSERVNSRIFIREDILREELDVAGFATTRFDRFAPAADPDDTTFLIEVKKKGSRIAA